MNDKELLELAAKAAGVDCEIEAFSNGRCVGTDKYNDIVFDPLTDDGDALRLAVKLGIVIWEYQQYNCALVEVRYPSSIGEVTEPINDDPHAATRRAIVRAAAEIGRSK